MAVDAIPHSGPHSGTQNSAGGPTSICLLLGSAGMNLRNFLIPSAASFMTSSLYSLGGNSGSLLASGAADAADAAAATAVRVVERDDAGDTVRSPGGRRAATDLLRTCDLWRAGEERHTEGSGDGAQAATVRNSPQRRRRERTGRGGGLRGQQFHLRVLIFACVVVQACRV